MLRQLANDSSIGILYFNNDIEDNIGWNNDNYRFENLGEVKTRGYEVTLEKKINDSLNLNSSFTRSRARQFPSGNQLLREPRHIFRASASYEINKDSKFLVDYRQIGEQVERYASQFAAVRFNKSYRVVDLTYSTKISKQASCDFRVENLLTVIIRRFSVIPMVAGKFILPTVIPFRCLSMIDQSCSRATSITS